MRESEPATTSRRRHAEDPRPREHLTRSAPDPGAPDPGAPDPGAPNPGAPDPDAPPPAPPADTADTADPGDPGEGGESPRPDAEALTDLWAQVQDALKKRVQPEQFETWFRRAHLTRVEGDVVGLAVLNNFAREWLENYYLETLENAVHAVLGVRRRIEITVDPELTVPPPQLQSAAPEGAPKGAPRGSTAEETTSTPTARPLRALPGSVDAHARAGASWAGSPPAMMTGTGHLRGAAGPALERSGGLLWNSDVVLNSKYTFENFVVGPCNRFGHAASMGAGESPGKNYNPFFLHGRVGVGKTHLLQAVCFTILERHDQFRILYLSCETFVNHFISALENGDLTAFRNKYRNVDVLVVDDIHLLANKERTQEEFFHTFNTLYNAGKQIVLSSDSPPKDIPTLQERLVSRFKWGMVTEIEPPCYETRMAIVKRKSRDRGHEVADDVAQLIAEHIDQNVRELEGAVTRLLGYSSLTGQPITIELAREALADIFQVCRGAPTMEGIISVVTEYFGVKLSDLQSKKRTKSIAFPRQVAMYLARKITRHSLEEIGGYFGGRDHSTVLYAVDRVQKGIAADAAAGKQIDVLLDRLQGGHVG